MKIILSRKGFDSAAGGGDSPILPDGRMISLPIPSADARTYDEIVAGAETMAEIIDALFGPVRLERIGRHCHLDPDIDRNAVPRRHGWRGVLGQVGAAATHLANQGVGVGDLFLFFGRFRHARRDHGRLRFIPGSRPVHALFGYLEVGQVLHPAKADAPPRWLTGHPHLEPRYLRRAENTLYMATERLSFAPSLPGSGRLGFIPQLQLTRPGAGLCHWQLPATVFAGIPITYHNAASWCDGDFRAASRGQEFVVDATSAVQRWARRIVRDGVAASG